MMRPRQTDFPKFASKLRNLNIPLLFHYECEQEPHVPLPATGVVRVRHGSSWRCIECGSGSEGRGLLCSIPQACWSLSGGWCDRSPQAGLGAHRSPSSKSVGLGSRSIRRSRRSARRSSSCVTPAYRVLNATSQWQKADGNVCLFFFSGSNGARSARAPITLARMWLTRARSRPRANSGDVARSNTSVRGGTA